MLRSKIVWLACLLLSGWGSPGQLRGQAAPLDFVHTIVPILKTHCVTCHGGREREGDFSINRRADVIHSEMVKEGDPDHSRLIELITSRDPDDQMPPSDRPRLSEQEVTVLKAWIRGGLPWSDGFTFDVSSYEPPLRPRVVELPPAVAGRDHPIDRLLDHYLQAQQRPLPAVVDDETFLRRATLDLIGLLPTADEIQRFRQDPSRDKRDSVIDSLLARRIDYADHWLTFFNDLLRNDYSGTGFITGGRKQISQWLYEALLNNKPFDVMTRELVAPPTTASRGYIDGIQWRGNVSAGQTLEMQFAQSVSQSFLGINLKCASCHDSFIDRWTLQDAYGLAAIYAESSLDIHRCDRPTGKTQQAAWMFPELGQVDPQAPREQRLQQLAQLITDQRNGRYARTIVNRLWHRLLGRGIVHPLDAMQTEPWHAELLDYLANQLVEQDYDLKAMLRLITTSQAYQSQSAVMSSEADETDYVYAGPLPRRLTAEQFMDAVWRLTEAAPRDFVAPVFRYDLSAAQVKDVELQGEWIWGPQGKQLSPAGEQLLLRTTVDLPADVVAGGAIMTCDNEFNLFIGGREVAGGTDWTQLQTLVLRGLLKQGTNQLVFRVKNAGAADSHGPAGLYFEARLHLADGTQQTLVSDGSWEYHQQVPQVREGRLAAPAEGWERANRVNAVAAWQGLLERDGRLKLATLQLPPDQIPMVRASLLKNTPLLKSLGRPIRDQIVSMRPSGLTTLEAIDLANEESLATALQRGGEVWSQRSWESTTELVESLFWSTLTRGPTPAERQLYVDFLGDQPQPAAISDCLWALCMLPEFMLVR